MRLSLTALIVLSLASLLLLELNGYVGEGLDDVADSLSATLAEDHSGARTKILGMLYEAESTLGLITSTKTAL